MKKVLLFASCISFITAQAQQSQVDIKDSPQNQAEMSPTANSTPIPSDKAMWDIDLSFNATAEAGSSGQAGIAFINNEFWTSRWQNDTIYRFSASGTFIQAFTIPGVSGTRSMTTDGTNLYIGNASTTINVVNPGTQTVTTTITSSAPVNSRFLAYDASLDGGNGGFWTGDFSTDIVAIDMSGGVLSTIPSATHGLGSKYGAAVDPTFAGGAVLWVFHQEGANTTQMTALDLATGMSTGITRDVYADISGTYSLTSGLAGGAFFTTDFNGGSSLVCLAQGDPNNVVVVYDVGTNVSLGENKLNDLSVYPVPASEEVNISLEKTLAEGTVAQLFDMNGRVVLTQELASGTQSFEMNVSDLAEGVYELTINANGTTLKKRVVVQ